MTLYNPGMHMPSLSLALLPLIPTMVLLGARADTGPTNADDPAPKRAALDLRSESCGKCHKTIYEQWKESRHAHAWTNQPFKDWRAKKRKPESCNKCHIPQPVLDTAPKQPTEREDRLDEGVGCASCHVMNDKVHGPYGKECDAHTNVKSPLFAASNVDLCQSCHRVAPKPVISLGKDFERSDLLKQGKNCRGCHMPEFEGHSAFDEKTGKPIGEKRKLKSHAFIGASHEEMTKKAFGLEVEKTEAGYTLHVTNECGHRLPGLTLRRYELRYALTDAKGKELVGADAEITTKKSLKLDKKLSVDLAAAEGATMARVRFTHFWQPKPKGPWQDKGQVLELTAPLKKQ